MKTLLIIFMALATFAVNAQDKNLEKREHHREMKSKLTPEQQIDFKLKKMTTSLDLNADQQEKMRQLFLEKRNERSGMYKNRKEMTDAQRDEAKKAMLDRRITFKNQMKDILTEEQITKWKDLQSERHSVKSDRGYSGKTRMNHKNKLQD